MTLLTIQTDLIFNPINVDFKEYENPKNFFYVNNIALIMTDDQLHADEIKESISDPAVIEEILILIEHNDAKVPLSSKYTKAYNSRLRKKMKMNKDGDSDYSDPDSSDDDDDESNLSFGYTQEYADQLNEMSFEHSKPKSGFDQTHRTSTRLSSRRRNSTLSPTRTSKRGSSIRGLDSSVSREEVIEAMKKKLQREKDKKLARRHEVPTMALLSNEYGLPSVEIENAEDIRNHIICHGCDSNLILFVEELRRPSVRLETYHPLVIVDENVPSEWESIKNKYNDCYFMKGNIVDYEFFQKLNIDYAYTLILLSSREEMLSVDGEKINSISLFNYLKLELWVPSTVFFTIELNTAANIAVLNATILRRIRMSLIEQQEKMLKLTGPQSNNIKVDMIKEKPAVTILQSLGLSSKRIGPTSPSLSDKKNDPPNNRSDEVITTTTSRRKSVMFDGNGRFATKRKMSSMEPLIQNTSDNNSTGNNRRGSIHNRLSNINGPLMLSRQNATFSAEV